MSNTMQPTNLFKTPFAVSGTKNIIPATGDDTTGLANLLSGFPFVTQKPISQGGVAPQRTDFNGILYMLSAFSFFAQSGGVFTYDDSLDYDSPAIVFYSGALWFCIKANGPGTTPGAQTPGSDVSYWLTLAEYLYNAMIDAGINIGGHDIGDIKMHYGTSAPDGWFACDNSAFDTSKYPLLYAKLGSNRLPDFRGLVPRGYDSTGVNDPDGASRSIGSKQEDAGRNVTGNAPLCDATEAFDSVFTGCFVVDGSVATYGNAKKDYNNPLCRFDASQNWGKEHTANEFRGKNFSILFCIKHD